MAIARTSDAQIVQTYTTGTDLLAEGWEAARILRLENGRMAVSWDTVVGGTSEVLNISTLDNLAKARSPVITADTATIDKGLTGVSLAPLLNGGLLAAWNADFDAPASPVSGDSFARAFSTYGAPSAVKYNLSTAPAGGESGVAMTRLGNGTILSLWADTRTNTGTAATTDIVARVLSATGTAVGSEFVLNTVLFGQQFACDAATLGDGRAAAVWVTGLGSGSDILMQGLQGRFVSAAGAGSGSEFAIDTITTGARYDTGALDVLALGNGGFAVVWKEISASGEQIRVQRFDAAGAKQGGEFVVESAWGDRHISHVFTTELANGGYAIGWGLTGGGTPDAQFVRQFAMVGTEVGTKSNLGTLAGAAGLTRVDDMELMSSGAVVAFGTKGTNAVATQIFDFGTKTLTGTSLNDTLYGHNAVDDRIIGGTGNDRLSGLSGNDFLDAGAGNDILTGGAGNDTYLFNTSLGSRDTITDYTAANDTMQLENAIFRALGTKTGTLSWIMFQASATGLAKDPDDRILYNTTTGVISYDADGSGSGKAIPFAVLEKAPYISAIEFQII